MEKQKVNFTHTIHLMGQDSEFFLWNPAKEKVIPSYEYFPKREDSVYLTRVRDFVNETARIPHERVRLVSLGKKVNRFPYTYTNTAKVRVFRDGLAVEVNTDPTNCRGFLWNGVRMALLLGKPWSRESKQRTWTARPWVEVTPQLITHFPEDLKILGCSPSLDAYTESEKHVGVDPLKTYFRTCGSHLHMSFLNPKGPSPETWSPIIKLADLLIGVPFAYIFNDELEFKRRELYGQAGEFRFQRYSPDPGRPNNGLEYRVLSSRLWDHPAVAGYFTGVWKYIIGQGIICQELWANYDPAWEDAIKAAINTGDAGAMNDAMAAMEKLTSSRVMPTNIPVSTAPELLRKAQKAGCFSDAGIINNLELGDGHVGINEWSHRWCQLLPSN